MFFTALIMPLFSFFLISFFGSVIGYFGASFLCIFSLFFSLILLSSFYLFNCNYLLELFTWCFLGDFSINLIFYFDYLSIIFLSIIFIVSILVQFYSISYMSLCELQRFFCYMLIFTFFMGLLVVSGNFFLTLIGWEGVGLSSYLLIGFWNDRFEAIKSAFQALAINKIGDISFVISLFFLFFSFYSLNYDFFFLFIDFFNSYFKQNYIYDFFLFFFLLFLLLASFVKSAQFGFHIWLFDAMEGPTPVSSLLHAATMVTAGVYLVMRFYVFFSFSIFFLKILFFSSFISSFFIIFSDTEELKQAIAGSTAAHISCMFFILSLGGLSVSFYYLLSHAFSKALLFLAAGSIIHSNHNQLFESSSFSFNFYFTDMFIFISVFSLTSFPFIGLFISEELLDDFIFIIYDFNFVFFYILIFFFFWSIFSSSSGAGFIIVDYFSMPSRLSLYNLGDFSFHLIFSMLILSIFSFFFSLFFFYDLYFFSFNYHFNGNFYYYYYGFFTSFFFILIFGLFVYIDKKFYLFNLDFLNYDDYLFSFPDNLYKFFIEKLSLFGFFISKVSYEFNIDRVFFKQISFVHSYYLKYFIELNTFSYLLFICVFYFYIMYFYIFYIFL